MINRMCIDSPATGESFRMTHHLDFHFFPSRNLTVPSITELVSVMVSLCTSHYMYYTTPNVTTSRTVRFSRCEKSCIKVRIFQPQKNPRCNRFKTGLARGKDRSILTEGGIGETHNINYEIPRNRPTL